MADPYVTISEVCADGTGAVTYHRHSPVKVAQELASAWAKYRPMEQEEIFASLTCAEVQPIIDLLESVGADEVATAVEYAHARGDDDDENEHHDIYLKRKEGGEL